MSDPKCSGGPEPDLGAAVYNDSTLDYLDTGLDLRTRRPAAAAHDNLISGKTGTKNGDQSRDLHERLNGIYVLLFDIDSQGRERAGLLMSLAAAERGRARAEDQGQDCKVAIVQLTVVTELDRLHQGGDRH